MKSRQRTGAWRLTTHAIGSPHSRLGAFSHTPFAVMWVATTCSFTGLAISDTASAWLMTSLNPDPRAVSLVQIASTLPMFLCTVPAGVLADMVAPRRFLIILETFVTALMGLFGAVIFFHWLNPVCLLSTNFALSIAWSLTTPAWLSITPLLVPPRDLAGANAANSVGYNISRAMGPLVAGLALARLGPAAPYWIFAVADSMTIAALLWWRPSRKTSSRFTRGRFTGALRIGFRHAVKNKPLQATMIRTVAVCPFASAYLALLPLIARHQMAQPGPLFYCVLLAVVSVGAVLGSLALAWMRNRFGPDLVVALGTGGLAIALVVFGLARHPVVAGAAALIAGAAWTIVLAGLYVSAQIALLDWVRGRGLAIFLTVIFGSVTFGSAIWGQVAANAGLEAALLAAAAGALLAIPLSWRWKLRSGEEDELSASAPEGGADREARGGPRPHIEGQRTAYLGNSNLAPRIPAAIAGNRSKPITRS
jgi:predicted MFS family arabinose efflux permease